MFMSRGVALCALAVMLSACTGTRINQAPVEDKGTATDVAPSGNLPYTAPQPGVVAPVVKVLPGAENAGKPGYYSVRPGDTLIRIGLEAGQSWRDIARWNSLEDVNLIEVGQVLRVVPPVAGMASGATVGSGDHGGVVTRPITSSAVVSTPVASGAALPPSSSTAAQSSPVSVTPSPSVVAATKQPSAPAADDVNFIWPASGALIAGFDEARNKGYGIAGKVGDPVMASADGKVVYSGAGLRGYGNLIILKHNNTYLTAYAHNQTLLVKEDQSVRKGQKIAEMGSTDADRVKLHFEIRKLGKPVDPSRYLPSR